MQEPRLLTAIPSPSTSPFFMILSLLITPTQDSIGNKTGHTNMHRILPQLMLPVSSAKWGWNSAVNTVYIATPNLLHFEQAKRALLAGKHVILEKPFTTNLRDARELVEIARQKKLMLVDAVPPSFGPNFRLLREKLEGSAPAQKESILQAAEISRKLLAGGEVTLP